MKRCLRVMSSQGDTVLAEMDTEKKEFKIRDEQQNALRNAEIAELEALFNQKVGAGYAAFDITTPEKHSQIRKLDPNAEILLVPRMQGGMRRAYSRMNQDGDKEVFSFDDSVSAEVDSAKKVFDEHKSRGYAPFDAENTLMTSFRPDTDVLFVPKLQGGSR